MAELACTNTTEVMWLYTLRYFVTFYSERNKWECVKVGLGCISFFVIVLTEYFKTQKCANYKSDADRTKPLTYIKHANRSRHQSFYYLFSWNTFTFCATHLRTWRNRNDWCSEWHFKNTWNSLGLEGQKRYFEFPLDQKYS